MADPHVALASIVGIVVVGLVLPAIIFGVALQIILPWLGRVQVNGPALPPTEPGAGPPPPPVILTSPPPAITTPSADCTPSKPRTRRKPG